MTTDSSLSSSKRDCDDWLDRFEAEWQKGQPPRLADYLSVPEPYDSQYLREILELDLEYRWRRYGVSDSNTPHDEDLPRCPTLNDYVKRCGLDPSLLTNPELFAAEYRVRMRWGDHPDHSEYATRARCPADELEAALDRVDAELSVEATDRLGDHESYHSGAQTTVAYSDSPEVPESPSVPSPEPPKKVGRYKLEKRIGRGGFGEVWKAFDPVLGAYVAVKIPRPDKDFSPKTLDEFRQEGRVLAQFRSVPGVVKILDAGEHDNRPFIVSEWIEGEALSTRLAHGKPSFEHTAEIIATVAEALAEAHRLGFAHRDIKPGNILIDKRGRPILVDFGLAVTERETFREKKRLVGTAPYMSPEQIRGASRHANTTVDVYGLGVTLYRMLVGRLPFEGDTLDEYRELILESEPRIPRTIDDSIPEELQAICLKCIEKRPSDRYPTTDEIAIRLRGWLYSSKNKSIPWGIVVLVVGFSILFAGLLVLFFWNGHNDPKTTLPENPTTQSRIPERVGVNTPFDWGKARVVFRDEGDDERALALLDEGVRIESQGRTLVEFTETNAIRYRLRFRLKIQQRKELARSIVGIALGFRSTKKDKHQYRFQTVELRQTRINTSLVRTLSSGTLAKPDMPNFSHIPFESEEINEIETGVYTLDLAVGRRGLELVTWQGRSIAILTTPSANRNFESEDFSGGIGIYCKNATVEILEGGLVVEELRP